MKKPVEKPFTKIGRSRENQVCFNDSEISRQHCVIEYKSKKYILSDLSRNGTLLNGEKVKSCNIKEGDIIAIGQWSLFIQRLRNIDQPKTIIDGFTATKVSDKETKSNKKREYVFDFSITTHAGAHINRKTRSNDITIGSDKRCTIYVSDPFVSRQHCRISVENKKIVLSDLASTNGTYVDEKRVSKITLPKKSFFQIGNTKIDLHAIKHKDTSHKENFGSIVGKSKSMKLVFKKIENAALNDECVYIAGESGTGKELVAREIHMASSRSDKPFIAINCGAIPANIIESQLFGHEKGSFTGALENSVGLFEQADKGTIFLDEIGEMPLELQTRLLRVLEDKKIRSVGSKIEKPVDIRIVCATNQNLKEKIYDGSFRPDLFYRIYVYSIELPPLRSRTDDITLLTDYFLQRLTPSGREITLSQSAMDKIKKHLWPGNVRELKNTLLRSIINSSHDKIDAGDIDIVFSCFERDDTSKLREIEKSKLIATLNENGGNISASAQKLGIARTTLQAKLRKHRIKNYR